MNSCTNPYTSSMVADSPEEVRAAFIRKAYGHVAAALSLFAGVAVWAPPWMIGYAPY